MIFINMSFFFFPTKSMIRCGSSSWDGLEQNKNNIKQKEWSQWEQWRGSFMLHLVWFNISQKGISHPLHPSCIPVLLWFLYITPNDPAAAGHKIQFTDPKEKAFHLSQEKAYHLQNGTLRFEGISRCNRNSSLWCTGPGWLPAGLLLPLLNMDRN